MESNLRAPTDSESILGLRDGRSYHLFKNGLLVFERALGPSGPYRLLISRARVCTRPQCDCRDVNLSAIGLDVATGTKDFPLESKELGALLDGPQAMSARLHIDLGLIEPDDYDGQSPLTQEWAEYAQSQVDSDLLDDLHEEWLRAKGLRRKTQGEIAWPSIEPGELVGWYELHAEHRRDSYLQSDAVFIAEELYCTNTACTCTEATINFSELTAENRVVSVGHLRVNLPDMQVTEWKPKRDRELLEKLWTAFQARHHRVGERLAHRKRQVAELAASREAKHSPAVAAQRIGRNEPCPCGSGKKYKRCCAS